MQGLKGKKSHKADQVTKQQKNKTASQEAVSNKKKIKEKELQLKKSMMQAIAQAANAEKDGRKEAENAINATRSVQVMLRNGGSALKQPTCDWKVADNTKNYETEIVVKDIFKNNSYNMQDNEMVTIIHNWLGIEQMQFNKNVKTSSGCLKYWVKI